MSRKLLLDQVQLIPGMKLNKLKHREKQMYDNNTLFYTCIEIQFSAMALILDSGEYSNKIVSNSELVIGNQVRLIYAFTYVFITELIFTILCCYLKIHQVFQKPLRIFSNKMLISFINVYISKFVYYKSKPIIFWMYYKKKESEKTGK